LLVSVQEYSGFYWLWQAFRNKKFVLCYSDEILDEYQEIIERYYSHALGKYVIDAILNAPHAEPIKVYYRWQLIAADPDDNKFVDCAVSANVNYLVTNDKHFKALEYIDFPKVNILTIDEFKGKI